MFKMTSSDAADLLELWKMVDEADAKLPEPKIICTWKELANFAEKYSQESWLFRSVPRKSYNLIPSISREGQRHSGFSAKIRPFNQIDERQLLDAFIREARPYLSYTPQETIEWLAIGQHHGLATRLLD